MLSHLISCTDQTHKTIKVCRQYFIPYLVYNLHSRKLAEKVFKKGSKKKKKSTSMLKEIHFYYVDIPYSLFISGLLMSLFVCLLLVKQYFLFY